MKVVCLLGLVALVAAVANAAPAPKAQTMEYIGISDVVDAVHHVKDIFAQVKAKIESGVVKGEIEDFLKHIRDVVEAKIREAKPAVAEILAKMKAAIQDMIDRAEAGIDGVKPVLQELVENILAKIAELKDKIIGGYNIFDDLLNDVLKPALGKAIENLIPAIQKHLGDLIGKLVPNETVEYLALEDIKDIAQHVKDIFNELKAKIVSGEVKANIVDFLKKLQLVVEAKIAEAKPVVKAALEKVKAAIDEMIAKAKANAEAGIEQGKGLLVQLLKNIMAKLAELKDNLTGYRIFDKDWFNDLLDDLDDYLEDLLEDILGIEYVSIADITEVAQHIKDVFNELKAKIESGEVKANIVDFLQKLQGVVDAKIAEAKPVVKAILEKVKAAIDEMIAKAKANVEAGIEQGKGLLVQLLKNIMAKLVELKDNLNGYRIFDKDWFNDLLDDLDDCLEDLLEDLGIEYVSIADIMEVAQHIKDVFNELKAKIESGEVKANIVDFLKKLQGVVDAKIAEAKPVVKAILEKVKAAIDEMIAKAKANAEAGIEQGKGLLVQLLKNIMAKLVELKDNLTGYRIFDKDWFNDLLDDLDDYLEDLLEDILGIEYVSIADITEVAQHIKDVFNELKAKIESGEVKANIVDFLKKLQAVVDAKIAEAKPVAKAILEKVKAAIDEMIAKAKANAEAGIEQGKGLLVQLLKNVMAKLAELKDNLVGYIIFDEDWFNDLFLMIILRIVDFLKKLQAVVNAKIAEAKPVVKAALEKVKAAIDEMIAKAKEQTEAGIEAGRGLLVQLFEKIMAKLAELKDSLIGYNIFEDLLKDVVKP